MLAPGWDQVVLVVAGCPARLKPPNTAPGALPPEDARPRNPPSDPSRYAANPAMDSAGGRAAMRSAVMRAEPCAIVQPIWPWPVL
jgi:hypothetical protein